MIFAIIREIGPRKAISNNMTIITLAKPLLIGVFLVMNPTGRCKNIAIAKAAKNGKVIQNA